MTNQDWMALVVVAFAAGWLWRMLRHSQRACSTCESNRLQPTPDSGRGIRSPSLRVVR